MKTQLVKFTFILTLFLFVLPSITFAKEYYYNSITVDAKVNKDATVDITEKLDFHFDGEFHKGWRSIPLKGMDAITDIEVYDEFGDKLEYSRGIYNKLDKHGWGKYTTRTRNKQQIIEWYYPSEAASTTDVWTKEFTLKYVVHGAITPYYNKGIDELYWNLFTDYDVPVMHTSGTVTLPDHNTLWNREDIEYTLYAKPHSEHSVSMLFDTINSNLKGITYDFDNHFPSHGKATIAIGWPHGFVDMPTQKEYWVSMMYRFFGVFALLVALIVALLIWIFTEWLPMKSKTIIPRYTPPHDYSPAIMDIIMNEGFTKKTLPAMVIDLANRGYWTIKEVKKKSYTRLIIKIVLAGFIIFVVISVAQAKIVTQLVSAIQNININFNMIGIEGVFGFSLFMIIFFHLSMHGLLSIIKKIFNTANWPHSFKDLLYTTEYHIKKTDNTIAITDYENDFVDILFRYGSVSHGREMSTAVFKIKAKNPTFGREIKEHFKQLRKDILQFVDKKVDVFKLGLSYEKLASIVILIVGSIIIVIITVKTLNLNFALSALAILVIIRAFVDAKLTKKGRTQKAELLGFKMYLETAERYHLQDLTPETFVKFLPYAMVFGIEERWAKVFEKAGITIEQPQWYSGDNARAVSSPSSGSHVGSSFSPTAFSAAIAGSFATAVSSSTGGASGGGGSAGGGSGGGGGGAS